MTDSLLGYLAFAGIVLCNQNPYLPGLDDIGCTWADTVALIGRRQLFYCKAFHGRTTYLSVRAYFLLKRCKERKPLTPNAAQIHELIGQLGIVDMDMLKQVTGLSSKAVNDAIGLLLASLYITAYENGRTISENWSTFRYATAERWEAEAEAPPIGEHPEAELRELLSATMAEKEIDRFLT